MATAVQAIASFTDSCAAADRAHIEGLKYRTPDLQPDCPRIVVDWPFTRLSQTDQSGLGSRCEVSHGSLVDHYLSSVVEELDQTLIIAHPPATSSVGKTKL
jgi:hypothetical protein